MEKVFEFMKDFDDDELPDGAWQAVLMDAVTYFNEAAGTSYDPFETWLAYTKLKNLTP